MNKNIPIFGFVIGLILPFLGLKIVQYTRFSYVPYFSFLDRMIHEPTTAFPVFSLSILANILPFMYYTSKRLDLTARGIFLATMLYVGIIVFMKYVL